MMFLTCLSCFWNQVPLPYWWLRLLFDMKTSRSALFQSSVPYDLCWSMKFKVCWGFSFQCDWCFCWMWCFKLHFLYRWVFFLVYVRYLGCRLWFMLGVDAIPFGVEYLVSYPPTLFCCHLSYFRTLSFVKCLELAHRAEIWHCISILLLLVIIHAVVWFDTSNLMACMTALLLSHLVKYLWVPGLCSYWKGYLNTVLWAHSFTISFLFPKCFIALE